MTEASAHRSLVLNHTVRPFTYIFFFNDTATTEIYTLSLHDALPISRRGSSAGRSCPSPSRSPPRPRPPRPSRRRRDRKSTRLNSSHSQISYAVFCLKKKTQRDVRELAGAHHRGADLVVTRLGIRARL